MGLSTETIIAMVGALAVIVGAWFSSRSGLFGAASNYTATLIERIEKLETKLDDQENLIHNLEDQYQDRVDEIAKLKAGVMLLISQLKAAGISPLWEPDQDDSQG